MVEKDIEKGMEEDIDLKEEDKEAVEEVSKESIKNKSVSKKSFSQNSKKKKDKKKKKIAKKIAIIVLLIVVLSITFYFALKTLTPYKVSAKINGEVITEKELEEKYAKLPINYKMLLTKDLFLDQLIVTKILVQEAKKKAISVNRNEIQEEINNLKKQVQSEKAFDEQLKQKGISLFELEKQIEEQLVINKLLEKEVFSKIEVSDSTIKNYYEANKDSFKAKDGEIRVKHILVTNENEAEQLLNDLKKGANFEELAQSKSIDIVSAQKGGDLGFIKNGQMIKEFEDAAFALNIGEVSPIIKSQWGYHLIKRGADEIPYEEAKEQIREKLMVEISDKAIKTYIDQLKFNSIIIKKGVKITTKIETFTKTTDDICKKDDKVIIALFSTTKNQVSNWIGPTFDNTVKQYFDKISAYHWQLDIGDDTLTEVKEDGVSVEQFSLFQKYNPKSTIPTYVFGCSYIRIGNAYDTLAEEEAEFKRIIEKLI